MQYGTLALVIALIVVAIAAAYAAGLHAGQTSSPPPATGTVGVLGTIEAIRVARFTDLGDGAYTATVGELPGLQRGDGTPPGPEDVLSMQPDGSLQLRAPGMVGVYERCTRPAAGLLCYRPVGERTWLVPYVTQTPN